MKTLDIVLIVLGALVFLMLGSFLFFMVGIGLCPLEDVIKEAQRLYAHRIITGIVGIFFLVIGYVGVKLLIKRSYRDEIFVVDSEYGRTSISLVAINDLLRKALKHFHAIKKSKMRIRADHKKLNVHIHLILWTGKPAREVVKEIQDELKMKLTSFVGIKSDHLNIVVKVDKVIEDKTDSSKSSRESTHES